MRPNIREIVVHIVDDDESVRKSLSRLMRSAGIESRAYESAEVFLAGVRNEPQGCILLDITLSHMSGLELLRALQEKGIQLPVIVLSATENAEVRDACRDLGVRFFLRKPVDDQALLDTITWVIAEPVGS